MFTPSMGSSIPGSSSSHAASEPPSTKQGRRQQAASSSSQEGPDRDVVRIMLKAVYNVAPLMKVQTIRAGTRVVHVPKVVMPGEQRSLAVRWVCCPLPLSRVHRGCCCRGCSDSEQVMMVGLDPSPDPETLILHF